MSLLKIEDLVIHFKSESGDVHAVNGVSLSVDAGKTLGLVGETGAGKTTTALGILRLVPEPGEVLGGTITYKDKDIMTMSEKEVQDIRGNEISMIFQDPMTALNPVMTVGDQMAEVILRHQNCTKVEAQQRMIDILEQGGHRPRPRGRLSSPVLRRHEAARGHRHRAGLQPQAAAGGRAYHRSGCDHSGAGACT